MDKNKSYDELKKKMSEKYKGLNNSSNGSGVTAAPPTPEQKQADTLVDLGGTGGPAGLPSIPKGFDSAAAKTTTLPVIERAVTDVGKRFVSSSSQAADEVGKSWEDFGNLILDNVSKTTTKENYDKNKEQSPLTTGIAIAGGAGSLLGELLGSTVKLFAKTALPEETRNSLKSAVSTVVKSTADGLGIPRDAVDTIHDVYTNYTKDFSEEDKTKVRAALGLTNFLGLGMSKSAGEQVLNTAKNVIEEGAPIVKELVGDAVATAKNISTKTGEAISGTTNAVKETVGSGASKVKELGSASVNKPRTWLTELFDSTPDETKNILLRDPKYTEPKYNQFVEQQKKHIANIDKAPEAIEVVATDATDGLKQIAEKRKQIGATKGAELKKISTTKIPEAEKVVDDFYTKAFDEIGVNINSKQGVLPSSKGTISNLLESEKNILSDYATDLQLVRKSPTGGNIDNFAQKWNKRLFTETRSNVIPQGSNVERVIKGNLSELKATMDKFPEYKASREEYARLSEILDEGNRLLGKTSTEGEAINAAAMVKRAILSLSDGGSRDFLMTLEKETGKKYMADAVIAMKAMEDLGGFTQSSFLKDGIKQFTATGNRSMKDRVLNPVINWVGEKTLGTPEEQTKRIIKKAVKGSKK